MKLHPSEWEEVIDMMIKNEEDKNNDNHSQES